MNAVNGKRIEIELNYLKIKWSENCICLFWTFTSKNLFVTRLIVIWAWYVNNNWALKPVQFFRWDSNAYVYAYTV